MTAASRTPRVSLGERLAAERRAAGYTVRALAAKLGWSYSTLAGYETGRRQIHIAQLAAIAHALGRSPAALLLDDPLASAIVDQLDGDPALCAQVAFFLSTLTQE